jgi:transposase
LERTSLPARGVGARDFPIPDRRDENACSPDLLDVLDPEGLRCPRGRAREGFQVHRSCREPVLDSRGPAGGRVFKAGTGTGFEGTPSRPAGLVLIVRGFARGESTAQRARERRGSRTTLPTIRPQFPVQAQSAGDRPPRSETAVEADARDQKAGAKGLPHRDPDAPPRRRAHPRRGQGTPENDRPPGVGVVGRPTGPGRWEVVEPADQTTLAAIVERTPTRGGTVSTDAGSGSDDLPELNRTHATVCQTPGQREWARDEDGDGIRAVPNNPRAGIWTGVRHFLRVLRGVSKHDLDRSLGIIEWG